MEPEGTKGPHEDTSHRFMHQNLPIDLLPIELLLHVFRYVLPPSTLSKPRLRGDHTRTTPMAQAMQSKLTISQVNRCWHSVVQPLLYAEAPLHRPAQVHSFADALRGNPSLCHMLRELIFHCPASTIEQRDALISDLVFILTQCTTLRTIIFTDALFITRTRYCPSMRTIPAKITDAIEALHETLTHFEHWPRWTNFYAMVAASPRDPAVPHPAALERIVLESLEDLDLLCGYTRPSSLDLSNHFLSWELPRLKRLVLPETVFESQASFLQRFGQRVTYLEFCDRLGMYMYTYDPEDLPESVAWFDDFARVFPSLEHLVYHAHYAPPLLRLASHPTLTYIDVWLHLRGTCSCCLRLATSMEEAIPSEARWKKPRLLDDTLQTILRLPELFPPSIPAEELPCVHAIPGLSITQAAHQVYRNDMILVGR